MQKYIKIYLKHFDLGEQDILTCECCLKEGRVDGSGFDIHHIAGRGKDKDVIENLMCLCRKHHEKANSKELTKDELQLIHNYFLQGTRKRFVN
jgi:predicted restriction endonuclease